MNEVYDHELERFVGPTMRLGQALCDAVSLERATHGPIHPLVFTSAVTAFLEQAMTLVGKEDKSRVAANISGFLSAYRD